MAEDEKFISRWAKRKAESRAGILVEDDAAAETEAGEEAKDVAVTAEEAEDPDDHPAAGIDIESLDANSDFTVFMHEKVPHAIRRMALRKLWASDPIFSSLDGLNDYDEDFTDASTVVEGLKAAYDEAVRRDKAKEAAEAEARVAQQRESGDEAGAEAEPEADDAAEGEEEQLAAADEAADPAVRDIDDEDLEDGTDEA